MPTRSKLFVSRGVSRGAIAALCVFGSGAVALASCAAGSNDATTLVTDAAPASTGSSVDGSTEAAVTANDDAALDVSAAPATEAAADAPDDVTVSPDGGTGEDAALDAPALDAADAADAFDAAPAIPTAGLVGEWLCSGNVADTSGNGNNGAGTSIAYVSDRHGSSAFACGFNGSSSSIAIPNATSIDLSSVWSLSAWVQPSGFSALAGIASKYQSSNARGFTVRLGYTSPYTGIDVDEAMNVPDAQVGLLTQGAWSHVGVTVSGAAVLCYVNGSLAYSATAGYAAQSTADALEIGVDFMTRFFSGAIDDIRLYNRVLSPAEIEALYLAP